MTEPVKHVVKDGARYHVTSWQVIEGPWAPVTIDRCSEPLCEVNFRSARLLKAVGLDVQRHFPALSHHHSGGVE